jgi:hypothetical protein
MADVFLNRDKDDEGRAAWTAYCKLNPEKAAILLAQVGESLPESYAAKVSAKTKKKPAKPKEAKGKE